MAHNRTSEQILWPNWYQFGSRISDRPAWEPSENIIWQHKLNYRSWYQFQNKNSFSWPVANNHHQLEQHRIWSDEVWVGYSQPETALSNLKNRSLTPILVDWLITDNITWWGDARQLYQLNYLVQENDTVLVVSGQAESNYAWFQVTVNPNINSDLAGANLILSPILDLILPDTVFIDRQDREQSWVVTLDTQNNDILQGQIITSTNLQPQSRSLVRWDGNYDFRNVPHYTHVSYRFGNWYWLTDTGTLFYQSAETNQTQPQHRTSVYRGQGTNIYWLNANTGWWLGTAGYLAITQDGGHSWQPITTQPSVDWQAMYWSKDETLGLLVGVSGQALVSRDGYTWQTFLPERPELKVNWQDVVVYAIGSHYHCHIVGQAGAWIQGRFIGGEVDKFEWLSQYWLDPPPYAPLALTKAIQRKDEELPSRPHWLSIELFETLTDDDCYSQAYLIVTGSQGSIALSSNVYEAGRTNQLQIQAGQITNLKNQNILKIQPNIDYLNQATVWLLAEHGWWTQTYNPHWLEEAQNNFTSVLQWSNVFTVTATITSGWVVNELQQVITVGRDGYWLWHDISSGVELYRDIDWRVERSHQYRPGYFILSSELAASFDYKRPWRWQITEHRIPSEISWLSVENNQLTAWGELGYHIRPDYTGLWTQRLLNFCVCSNSQHYRVDFPESQFESIPITRLGRTGVDTWIATREVSAQTVIERTVTSEQNTEVIPEVTSNLAGEEVIYINGFAIPENQRLVSQVGRWRQLLQFLDQQRTLTLTRWQELLTELQLTGLAQCERRHIIGLTPAGQFRTVISRDQVEIIEVTPANDQNFSSIDTIIPETARNLERRNTAQDPELNNTVPEAVIEFITTQINEQLSLILQTDTRIATDTGQDYFEVTSIEDFWLQQVLPGDLLTLEIEFTDLGYINYLPGLAPNVRDKEGKPIFPYYQPPVDYHYYYLYQIVTVDRVVDNRVYIHQRWHGNLALWWSAFQEISVTDLPCLNPDIANNLDIEKIPETENGSLTNLAPLWVGNNLITNQYSIIQVFNTRVINHSWVDVTDTENWLNDLKQSWQEHPLLSSFVTNITSEGTDLIIEVQAQQPGQLVTVPLIWNREVITGLSETNLPYHARSSVNELALYYFNDNGTIISNWPNYSSLNYARWQQPALQWSEQEPEKVVIFSIDTTPLVAGLWYQIYTQANFNQPIVSQGWYFLSRVEQTLIENNRDCNYRWDLYFCQPLPGSDWTGQYIIWDSNISWSELDSLLLDTPYTEVYARYIMAQDQYRQKLSWMSFTTPDGDWGWVSGQFSDPRWQIYPYYHYEVTNDLDYRAPQTLTAESLTYQRNIPSQEDLPGVEHSIWAGPDNTLLLVTDEGYVWWRWSLLSQTWWPVMTWPVTLGLLTQWVQEIDIIQLRTDEDWLNWGENNNLEAELITIVQALYEEKGWLELVDFQFNVLKLNPDLELQDIVELHWQQVLTTGETGWLRLITNRGLYQFTSYYSLPSPDKQVDVLAIWSIHQPRSLINQTYLECTGKLQDLQGYEADWREVKTSPRGCWVIWNDVNGPRLGLIDNDSSSYWELEWFLNTNWFTTRPSFTPLPIQKKIQQWVSMDWQIYQPGLEIFTLAGYNLQGRLEIIWLFYEPDNGFLYPNLNYDVGLEDITYHILLPHANYHATLGLASDNRNNGLNTGLLVAADKWYWNYWRISNIGSGMIKLDEPGEVTWLNWQLTEETTHVRVSWSVDNRYLGRQIILWRRQHPPLVVTVTQISGLDNELWWRGYYPRTENPFPIDDVSAIYFQELQVESYSQTLGRSQWVMGQPDNFQKHTEGHWSWLLGGLIWQFQNADFHPTNNSGLTISPDQNWTSYTRLSDNSCWAVKEQKLYRLDNTSSYLSLWQVNPTHWQETYNLVGGLSWTWLRERHNWLTSAQIENCQLGSSFSALDTVEITPVTILEDELSIYDTVIEWFDGIWHDGVWLEGDFINGDWYNGFWYRGRWTTLGGTTSNATYTPTTIASRWWQGYFQAGEWLGGEWYNGWFGGPAMVTDTITWHNGQWYGGIWGQSLPLTGNSNLQPENELYQWQNGEWHGGQWQCGIWNNGTWDDFTSFSVWCQGHWLIGTWRSGNWLDGWWGSDNPEQEAFFGVASHRRHPSTWQDGFWLTGVWDYWHPERYGVGDRYWLPGTYTQASRETELEELLALTDWQYSRWQNGRWQEGIWYGGHWDWGWWQNGTWLEGYWYGQINLDLNTDAHIIETEQFYWLWRLPTCRSVKYQDRFWTGGDLHWPRVYITSRDGQDPVTNQGLLGVDHPIPDNAPSHLNPFNPENKIYQMCNYPSPPYADQYQNLVERLWASYYFQTLGLDVEQRWSSQRIQQVKYTSELSPLELNAMEQAGVDIHNLPADQMWVMVAFTPPCGQIRADVNIIWGQPKANSDSIFKYPVGDENVKSLYREFRAVAEWSQGEWHNGWWQQGVHVNGDSRGGVYWNCLWLAGNWV